MSLPKYVGIAVYNNIKNIVNDPASKVQEQLGLQIRLDATAVYTLMVAKNSTHPIHIIGEN